MKKRKKLFLALAVCATFLMSAVLLAACDSFRSASQGDKPKYKLNFYVDSELYATAEASSGSTFELPAEPTKSGYVFGGWYFRGEQWNDSYADAWSDPEVFEAWTKQGDNFPTDDSGTMLPFEALGSEYYVDHELYPNQSFFPRWLETNVEERHFMVQFATIGYSTLIGYGETWPAEEEIPYADGEIHRIWVADAEDYVDCYLDGWYLDPALQTKWDPETPVTEDIVLFPKWLEVASLTECDILAAEGFEINGTTLDMTCPYETTSLDPASFLTLSPFATWKATATEEGGYPLYSIDLDEGDNTFYLHITSGSGTVTKTYTVNVYRQKKFPVSYAYYDITHDCTRRWYGGIEGQYVDDGAPAPQPELESPSGYTFLGWRLATDGKPGDTEYDWNTPIRKFTQLYAVYEANPYTITYLDSKDHAQLGTQTVHYGDENVELLTFSKDGYRFGGSYKLESGSYFGNNAGKVGEWHWAEDLTLYVTFIAYTYEVSYYGLEDGSHTNAGSYTFDTPFDLADAERYGYAFLGWYDAETDGNRVTRLGDVAHDMKLWAKWELCDVYLRTPDDLQAMGPIYHYILANDIDLEGAAWTPVGTAEKPFTGTFDGQGYAIKNFKITALSSRIGLFGENAGIIRNLCVEDIRINWNKDSPWKENSEDRLSAGGLVGYNRENGLIENCHTMGSITITLRSQQLSSGWLASNVINVGGLVGNNDGTIGRCYSACSVSGYSKNGTNTTFAAVTAGGFAGINRGTIENCYAMGTVLASGYVSTSNQVRGSCNILVGGFSGYAAPGSVIKNCYASGNVSCKGTCSAPKAKESVLYVNIGGFAGSASEESDGKAGAVFENCVAFGNLNSNMNSHASSNASSRVAYKYGGFLGDGDIGVTVKNCYVSDVQSIVQSHYAYEFNDTENTTGSKKSLEEIKTVSFFVDTLAWSDEVWEMTEGSFPVLKVKISAEGGGLATE